jgi:hypothetical protein
MSSLVMLSLNIVSVIVVLLLEASMTMFTFWGFWRSASISWEIQLVPLVADFIVLAPMAGLGEHLIFSDIWVADREK